MKKINFFIGKAEAVRQKTRVHLLFFAAFSVICFSRVSLLAQWIQVYEGPPAPGQETAVVIPDEIQFLSINGVARCFMASAVEFLPGEYELLVRHLSSYSSSRPLKLAFRAETGHNYVLAGTYDTKGGFFSKGVYFTPFIEDISRNEYNPDSSKLTEKKYKKFNQQIAKSRVDHLKEYNKFLGKLGSFEPVKLTFFEYDGSTIPQNIKANASFDLASTRYILAQLKVKNLNPDLKEHRHTLRWDYYCPAQWTAEGKLMKSFHVGSITSEMLFKQGQEYSFPWVSWGNKEKGWIWGQGKSVKGTYAVAVYLDKLEIFEDRFVIY
ncbi:MAG: DUF2057 domain-containing protein [Candidatus Aminicenantes bacterium]|nr:DUF2057 domain-containing protein [Candidatus Aminicenantes bacterium]